MNQQTNNGRPGHSRLEAAAMWILPAMAIVVVSSTAAMKRKAAVGRADRENRVEAAVQAAVEEESRRLDDGANELWRILMRLDEDTEILRRIDMRVGAIEFRLGSSSFDSRYSRPLPFHAEEPAALPAEPAVEPAGAENAAGPEPGGDSIRGLLGPQTNGTFRQIYADGARFPSGRAK